jgi:hypothetical protein
MNVNGFVMARSATVDGEGQPMINGMLERIEFSFAVPASESEWRVIWPNCALVAFLECSIADGLQHTIGLRIVDDDERRVVPDKTAAVVTFPTNGKGRPMRMVNIIELEGLPLACPGDYRAILLINGQPAAEYAFYVEST